MSEAVAGERALRRAGSRGVTASAASVELLRSKPMARSSPPETSEAALVQAARGGDRGAFEALCRDARQKLRGVLRKLVGHPDQTDDLMQEALTKAWFSLASFDGRSAFSTWLCRIGVNLALDFLRGQKRWRERAQVAYASECTSEPELAMEVGSTLMAPDFVYDVNEHIAFCFQCVGRSLEPELQAALVLREVLELGNQEAARELGLSEPVLRHRVSEARATMQAAFEGLCTLVSKTGVCYQCKGLREVVADPAHQGDPPPDGLRFERRLEIWRQTPIDQGRAQALHDLFWRRIATQERDGKGSIVPGDDCAPATEDA